MRGFPTDYDFTAIIDFHGGIWAAVPHKRNSKYNLKRNCMARSLVTHSAFHCLMAAYAIPLFELRCFARSNICM
jgi:hypothetical protein